MSIERKFNLEYKEQLRELILRTLQNQLINKKTSKTSTVNK